jgi:hypothetical protein
MTFVGMAIGIPVAVLGFCSLPSSDSPAARATDLARHCRGPLDFYVRNMTSLEAADLTRNNLRAPTTAQFPFTTTFSVARDDKCRFTVNGYVDSQNGFGAMIRSQFEVHLMYPGVQPNGDTKWTYRTPAIND